MNLEIIIILPIVLLQGVLVGLQAHIYYNDASLILLQEKESKSKSDTIFQLSSIEQPLHHLHRISMVLMILSVAMFGLIPFLTMISTDKVFGILLFLEAHIIIIIISNNIASLCDLLRIDVSYYCESPMSDKLKRILLRIEHKSDFSTFISLIAISALTLLILQMRHIISI